MSGVPFGTTVISDPWCPVNTVYVVNFGQVQQFMRTKRTRWWWKPWTWQNKTWTPMTTEEVFDDIARSTTP